LAGSALPSFCICSAPQQQAQFGGCGLQQHGHEDMEGAETGAEAAQLGPVFLGQLP
jgi:hypothetical protein